LYVFVLHTGKITILTHRWELLQRQPQQQKFFFWELLQRQPQA
jgi:hypothetical protein